MSVALESGAILMIGGGLIEILYRINAEPKAWRAFARPVAGRPGRRDERRRDSLTRILDALASVTYTFFTAAVPWTCAGSTNQGGFVIPVRRCVFALVVLLGLFTLPTGVAQASRSIHPRRACLPVSATGVGQDLGGGHTQATISSHGFVLGHTAATFTATAPVSGVESFTGPIVFGFRGGTLTAQVNGTASTTTGAFEARSTSITGTGLAAGVTGHVTISGTEGPTGSFTETITGSLCLG